MQKSINRRQAILLQDQSHPHCRHKLQLKHWCWCSKHICSLLKRRNHCIISRTEDLRVSAMCWNTTTRLWECASGRGIYSRSSSREGGSDVAIPESGWSMYVLASWFRLEEQAMGSSLEGGTARAFSQPCDCFTLKNSSAKELKNRTLSHLKKVP